MCWPSNKNFSSLGETFRSGRFVVVALLIHSFLFANQAFGAALCADVLSGRVKLTPAQVENEIQELGKMRAELKRLSADNASNSVAVAFEVQFKARFRRLSLIVGRDPLKERLRELEAGNEGKDTKEGKDKEKAQQQNALRRIEAKKVLSIDFAARKGREAKRDKIDSFSISNDGQWIIASSDNGAFLLENLKDPKKSVVFSEADGQYRGGIFSPDSRYLVLREEKKTMNAKLTVYDLKAKNIKKPVMTDETKFNNDLDHVEWAENGLSVLWSDGGEYAERVDIKGKKVKFLEDKDDWYAGSNRSGPWRAGVSGFMNDPKALYQKQYGVVRNEATKKVIRTESTTGKMSLVGISGRAAVFSVDQRSATVIDLKTGKQHRVDGHFDEAKFSSGGDYVALLGRISDELLVIKAATGETVDRFDNPYAFDFMPKSSSLLITTPFLPGDAEGQLIRIDYPSKKKKTIEHNVLYPDLQRIGERVIIGTKFRPEPKEGSEEGTAAAVIHQASGEILKMDSIVPGTEVIQASEGERFLIAQNKSAVYVADLEMMDSFPLLERVPNEFNSMDWVSENDVLWSMDNKHVILSLDGRLDVYEIR